MWHCLGSKTRAGRLPNTFEIRLSRGWPLSLGTRAGPSRLRAKAPLHASCTSAIEGKAVLDDPCSTWLGPAIDKRRHFMRHLRAVSTPGSIRALLDEIAEQQAPFLIIVIEYDNFTIADSC